ncbi:MAG TPA: hypothetical protein DCZ84_01760 [Candidatus Vogelbacteria bacterium]|uniref:Uncharacterized protein n=1 Tax=Candidatus Vogelbacteria bacterium RIFOXYD1_FULL_51_18 TaxID=1802440 RepID=A0A1G2QIB1_9BACT|nr:MAG: hypothetical protein UY66_C0007G0004 [Parcubacteria group bacterium GW2011_GWC1_51_35]KKW25147.1 MAG: hypothetical protein UY68_C0005G0005 [Parcubacteria group bacterium GW2011_GWF2_52_12]OHA60330.1 MAG: hypothetical protein A2569_02415 [Candidatus Vogelbacteria bacterium RIFOXYD1_FULL_51_18]HBB65349.1 hypothetical protein [Candidatus Vogelbacteria bacterium]HCQ92190.1 hypothetical protein [Candidatus Vogelbacteria bacterium]
MTILDQIATQIIKEQELIIGPVAWEEAKRVPGIHVSDERKEDVIVENGDKKEVVNKLVHQYDRLFGRASLEVCKSAVSNIIVSMPPSEVPSSLM